MSVPPDVVRRVGQWVEKAEHDLQTAEHTLTLEGNCPRDMVCFHAQQCVEKYLKAVLVAESVEFPRSHDLVILMKLVKARLPLAVELGAVQPLNRYTIEARYPGDWEPITREETDEAVDIARKVRAEARRFLPAETLGDRER